MRARIRTESVERTGGKTARLVSLRLAVTYGVIASLWVLFSDRVLGALGFPLGLERAISAAKGQLFVLFTAGILFVLAYRHLSRLYASEERSRRFFENASEGLILFRVERGENGTVSDLILEDVNPTESERLHIPQAEAVGMRMTTHRDGEDRLCAYFELVRGAAESGVPARTEIASPGEFYELIATYPIAEDLWAAGAMDVTEKRRAEAELRHQEERIRQAYVDVLDAVTGGKLLIVGEEELAGELGEPIGPEFRIDSPTKLSEARGRIADVVSDRLSRAERDALLSAVGEALNNALIHAGEGSYRVYAGPGCVQTRVSDRGEGIDFRTLPRATLVPGFSTTATLGLGFTIMLQLCDRVLLHTRHGETSVVLELRHKGAEA